MEMFQAVMGGDSDDRNSQSRGPCCSICCGLILLMIAPYVIWHNEGDYVKIQQALDSAGRVAKQPCTFDSSGRCSDNCKLDGLKDGDLVFLSCEFNNMRTLGDLVKDKSFNVELLAPALSGKDKAVGFKWNADMYQWIAKSRTQEIHLDTPDCPAAAGLDDDSDPGATRRKSMCCKPGTVGYKRFQNQYYGPDKVCQPYKGAPSSFHTEEFSKVDTSTDTKTASANTLFSGAPIVMEADGLNLDDEDEYEETVHDFKNQSDERLVHLRRMRGSSSSSDTRRRRTDFRCSFDCHSWKLDWSGILEADPIDWSPIPTAIKEVAYVNGPATNLVLPYSNEKSYLSDTKEGVNLGGITVGSFKPISTAIQYMNTMPSPTTGKQALLMSELSSETWSGMKYTQYQINVPWSANEATSWENCLVSRPNPPSFQVGDLRMCFNKTKLTQLTVIADVKTVQDGSWSGMKLAVSDKHLQAETKLKMTTKGYRMVTDRVLSFEEYMEEMKKENESSLYAFRILGPILLWAAFYCCLSPIVWLIDKFGDTLEMIPCVGGCLGIMADILETLVGILICIISCCCGIACGLMAMAIAWVYYRPLIGIPLLIVSTLIFVGVGYFMYSRRDPSKPSRRSVRMSTVGSAVELREETVQPAAAVAAPVAAAVPAPAVAVAMPQPTLFQVQCPEGSAPGSQILVTTPDGRQVSVAVPAGVAPGQLFQVQA